jgi:hypothetical protein
MARNYLRNSDDPMSDPEAIAARYQLGRNAFFEVALTLAEQRDNERANGASSGSAASAGSIALVSSGGYGGYGGGGFCPREDMYVWVCNADAADIRPVRVHYLADNCGRKQFHLYNPITKNANKLVSAVYRHEVPTISFDTERGAAGVVGETHKVIRNPSDLDGHRLKGYLGEVLSCFKEKQGERTVERLYLDQLLEVREKDPATVVEISLEKEFIYWMGEDRGCGTLAHNRKADPGDEIFFS